MCAGPASSPRRRALAAVLAGAVVLTAGTGQAWAHGETSPTIQTLVDEVEPDVAGVDFGVLPGPAARLSARNATGEVLEVLGLRDRPFLRIGPGGVQADVNSIDWYRSGNPDGIATTPRGVRLTGPPRWERVSRRPAWAWFDHRLHPATVQVPPEALEAQRTARLDDWVVPTRLGGRDVEVRGHVEYRPLLGAISPELESPAALTPSVQVSLLRGRLPGLLLVNTGARVVTVFGKEGEPFARIGPRGVDVNERSPTHVDDQVAKGEIAAVSDGGADASAAPQWRRVSSASSYAWLETRALYPGQRPPREISEGRERVVLEKWTVPVQAGARRLEIRGTTSWVPFRTAVAAASGTGDGSVAWLVAGGAVVLLALAGAAVARRRAFRSRPMG